MEPAEASLKTNLWIGFSTTANISASANALKNGKNIKTVKINERHNKKINE
jgi:hypothetical protein